MATIDYYIDAAATGAGDGTSWTDAYTTLPAFDNAEGVNLVTAGNIYHVHLRGSTAITGGPIDNANWVTDASNYIIYEGDWIDTAQDYTKAHIVLDSSNATAIEVRPSYTRFKNLQIENSAASPTSLASAIYKYGGTAGVQIDSCLLLGGRQCINLAGAGDCYVFNSIIINKSGSGGAGIIFNGYTGTANIYSCVVRGDSYGVRDFSGTTTSNIKNTHASNYTKNEGTMNMTTCSSEDTSSDTVALRSIAFNTTNFTNVTGGSEDYALPSGSNLIDVGTDTSGDTAPLDFDTDILGNTRSGTWDVSANEYQSAGSSIIPQVTHHYRANSR